MPDSKVPIERPIPALLRNRPMDPLSPSFATGAKVIACIALAGLVALAVFFYSLVKQMPGAP